MGLLKNISDAVKRSLSPMASAWLRGEDGGPRGGAAMSNAYEQSSWVYTAVNALSKNVSQIPFRISQGDPNDENILQRGAIVDLFNQPHPFIDRFFFWELLVTWICLRGEAFIVALDKEGNVLPIKSAGGRKNIDSLLILSPDKFWHIIENGTLAAWKFTGMNYNEPPLASQILLPNEVLHLRMPNPYMFWRGLSPLTVANLPASTDYASSQFMKGLMLNNADTGVIVTTDQQPSGEQREAILAALKDRKRQAGTADRPLFLWGGSKIEKPTVSSADMQFLENRKLNRLEIGAIFGVPSTVMGFSEDANRAVAGTERLQFVEQTIFPLCARLEAFVDPIVDAFGKNLNGFFHRMSLPIMQDARRNRGDAASKYFAMGVPLNDINRVFDLGLPQYAWGDTGYLPFNLQPAGTVVETPTNTTDDTSEGKTVKVLDGMLATLKSCVVDVTPVAGKKALPAHVCTGNPEYEASIAASVKNKKGKLGKFFFEQRGRVLAKMDKLEKALVENPVVKSIDDLFDKPVEDSALLGKMKPLLVGDLTFGGAQLYQEMGLSGFELAPKDAIAFLDKRKNVLTDVNATTFDALKTSLQEGLQAGETMTELTDRVKGIFQNATDTRAETIALTETNTAVNAGRFNAMGQAKVEKKGWQTSNLENVRASHSRAEQDYQDGIPLDQPFRVGGYDLMHPGDPEGPPQEVINCRCFTFAIQGGKAVRSKTLLKWEDFS